MAIDQNELLLASRRIVVQKSFTAAAAGQRTGFLCHSHRDRNLALGLQQSLRENGLDLYIDWQDTDMPEKPTGETARRIEEHIATADIFLFLATAHSTSSKWCPWELGYADGKKRIEQICLVTTRDATGSYGNEYLDLYRRIDAGTSGMMLFERAGQAGVSVRGLRIP